MYLTVKQQVKHLSKEDYLALKELVIQPRTLLIRQSIKKDNITSPRRNLTIKINMLCLKIARTIRFSIPTWHSRYLRSRCSFKLFFGLLKLAQKGKYAFKDCKLPHYFPKEGFVTLVIGFYVRIAKTHCSILKHV